MSKLTRVTMAALAGIICTSIGLLPMGSYIILVKNRPDHLFLDVVLFISSLVWAVSGFLFAVLLVSKEAEKD